MKEVGEIEDNKLTFLSIEIKVDIDTGKIVTDVIYDKRIIERGEILKETINKFVEKLYQNVLGERRKRGQA